MQKHAWGDVPVAQVTKVCQPLDDLRDVASSDSVDTFVLSYTSLLQVRTLWSLLSYGTFACPLLLFDRSPMLRIVTTACV